MVPYGVCGRHAGALRAEAGTSATGLAASCHPQAPLAAARYIRARLVHPDPQSCLHLPNPFLVYIVCLAPRNTQDPCPTAACGLLPSAEGYMSPATLGCTHISRPGRGPTMKLDSTMTQFTDASVHRKMPAYRTEDGPLIPSKCPWRTARRICPLPLVQRSVTLCMYRYTRASGAP